MPAAGSSNSTFPPTDGLVAARRSRRFRRIGFGVLTLVLLVALSGLLGVRTATRTEQADGVTTTLRFARITRPGLASVFQIRLDAPDGFVGAIDVGVSQHYLDIFDQNATSPAPADQRSDGEMLHWEFDRPGTRTFTFTLDARIEPAVQWPRDGDVEVQIAGQTVASFAIRTWILP